MLNICFVNKCVASVCIRLSSLTPGMFSDSRAIVLEGPGMVWSMMRSWIPLCFFCAPQVEDCATQTVNGAWNLPAMHYGWGKVHLIFRSQLLWCAVQCIVCFTVIVRPNKVWYNWQHCSPKCKYLSRHTTKAFMIKGIVQDAYFIKQNLSLLGNHSIKQSLITWILTPKKKKKGLFW